MPEIFKKETERVLSQGLNAMTKACEALSEKNKTLNEEIDGLKSEMTRLKEKALINFEERE